MSQRTLTLSLASLLAPLAVMAGCATPQPASSTGDPQPELKPDAMYPAGPFTVESGEDKTMCTYIRSDSDSDQDVTAFVTEQSKGGHHLIVYTIDHPVDLKPHLCSQGGQPSWTQVLATQLESEKITFPEGVGFRIKAHQQYVMETHFINTTSDPLDVTSHFGVVYGKAGEVKERAATYFFGTMNIDLAPNSTLNKTASCHPPKPMKLHTMFGHEHRMGAKVSVMHQVGDAAGKEIYHSTDWEAPEISTFDPGLEIGTNDFVNVSCDWNNTSANRLRYPHEMCFAIGYYWPADASVTCTSGGGKDECLCREQGNLDTGPGGAAVEVTLTRKDKVNGAGGDIDKGAPIYCALFRAEDYSAIGPKKGALPYYFRDAVDVALTTDKDVAKFDIQDVSPGDYAVSCMMDVIGGGFMPGKGDLANITAPKVTVKTGDVAHVDVVLDIAIP